jgi:hypothetical protein
MLLKGFCPTQRLLRRNLQALHGGGLRNYVWAHCYFNKYIVFHQSNEQICFIIIESFYSVLGTVHTCTQMFAILCQKFVGFIDKKTTNTLQCERTWFKPHIRRWKKLFVLFVVENFVIMLNWGTGIVLREWDGLHTVCLDKA